MKNVFMACLVAIALSGCATLKSVGAEAELPVKYATAKVIESSDSIAAQDVIARVQSARALIESNNVISIDALAAGVRESIDFSRLSPADALLVDALLSRIEARLNDYDQNLTQDQRNVRILTLLDWIEEVATLYAGSDY